jgi:transposase
VEDLEKEFPDNGEIKAFVEVMAPLLSTAMSLRGLPISDDKFYKQAAEIRANIIDVVHSPARHSAIRRIQEIFHEKEARLYHWASDRRIPPDNNLAERDLRPTVIARKVSFGSQSDAGAQTHEAFL